MEKEKLTKHNCYACGKKYNLDDMHKTSGFDIFKIAYCLKCYYFKLAEFAI